jgi:hypothetical protein
MLLNENSVFTEGLERKKALCQKLAKGFFSRQGTAVNRYPFM